MANLLPYDVKYTAVFLLVSVSPEFHPLILKEHIKDYVSERERKCKPKKETT